MPGYRLATGVVVGHSWKKEPMRVDPPYDLGLSVVGDVDTAVVEMRIHGRWSRRMCLTVHLAMRTCLAEHPSAMIIDLHGLSDPEAASTAMWLAASRAASLFQPPVQLLLSVPPTWQLASHLRRLGAVRHLSLFATTKQAREAVAERPPAMDRLHLNRLRPEPASADVAADAVAVACAAWDLPELTNRSRQITRELVGNAIRHAGTDMTLTMSLRGSGLHLAVHDGDQQLPCLLDPGAPDPGTVLARRGWQLRTVQAQASAWGAMPTREGKVVWAMVRPRRPVPPPACGSPAMKPRVAAPATDSTPAALPATDRGSATPGAPSRP
jgi:hypothetical protein